MYRVIFATIGSLLWVWFRLILRCRITGLENIPATGAVLAPNHQSFWDIPLIAVMVPRRVHFMAKEELFRVPVFGAIIRSLLAFPVKRGAPDRTAIRHAIEMLQENDLVVVFPEGTRSKTGLLGPFAPGAALIAMKAGVPMVPVGLIATNRIFRNGGLLPRIEIHFDKPVSTISPTSGDGRKSLEEVGQEVRISIEQMLNRVS